ncbi:barren [Ascodesmis nigricans]|uniref:Condensin complex subunit 2 n=1 Tax=Ascodesmis nigricans TaxID=341454 RepID=A0A4S2N1S0_9PEZI|nr:barren [Ascodesmis nigricans]
MARMGARRSSIHTPRQSGTKIPLNDDSAEKARRQRERNLLQEAQKARMAAAASPAASRAGTVAQNSPRTPRNVGSRGWAESAALDAVTPLRKVPILANFEEMMKMATDNKINAANSWNFALIDYFHDMSLLKEGDGVNFQKASCTLDGCVKIYTSRVDSVATETGKLLSGLAESKSKKGHEDEDADGSDAEGGEDGEGGPRRTRKKTHKSAESTLAKDFSQLQIKKLELEFNVDPLFKKATADFDEGGAKGLLLNHLHIDNNGRIVFDSSDDKEEEPAKGEEIREEEEGADGETSAKKEPAQSQSQSYPEDIEDKAVIGSLLSGLRAKFFPNLSIIDEQDVCPSLKNFDLGDPANSALDLDFLRSLDAPDDNGPEADAENVANRPDMAFGFDDGYEVDEDDMVSFGGGGDAWADQTMTNAAERMLSPTKGAPLDDIDDKNAFSVSFGNNHEDILSYFDEALRKNWAGPEHWRIRKIKDANAKSAAPPRQRKEKEAFSIDFLDPAATVPEDVLAPPKSLSTISLAKKDRISKTRHLLPDDKHFNSRQLLRLFLKPKASIRRRVGSRLNPNPNNPDSTAANGENGPQADNEPENLDENFWANQNLAADLQASSTPPPEAARAGNYDPNFFNDQDDDDLGLHELFDSDDDDGFVDALEELPGSTMPPPLFPGLGTQGGFGSQLVTGQSARGKMEKIKFARVAKKVDVRKLKENLWTGLHFEDQSPPTPSAPPTAGQDQAEMAVDKGGEKKFTDVINDLSNVYEDKVLKDISTSYCFICLLHLANEKGLVVEEAGGELQELVIRKDWSVTEQDAY